MLALPLDRYRPLNLTPQRQREDTIAALAAEASGNDSQIEALTGIYVFALAFLGPVGMREADRIWRALSQRS